MRIFLLVAFGLGYGVLYAQTDTLFLEPVEVKDSWYDRYTSGTNLDRIAIRDEESSLSAVLQGEPSIYFKTYGNGQLSSIAFRGTTAGHTAVLWHGVPANYPTLGEMDFSQWPAWFLESVDLQAGSAGALYGSGAIGGTVLLDSDVSRIEGQSPVQIRLGAGSFGKRFAGVKTAYSLGTISAATNVYLSDLQNDFNYRYRGDNVKQQHAGVLNYGIQQKLQYEVQNHQFAIDGVYTKNDREVQPGKSNPNIQNTLETDNFRLALTHSRDWVSISSYNSLAFLRNSTLYNDSLRTTARQVSLLSSNSWLLTENLSVRAGANFNFYDANSSNYKNQVQDFQSAVFVSLWWQSFDWMETSLNLRQSFYLKNKPFTPSIGNEVALVNREHFKLSSNQQLSMGFRYPTLNQLYWSPGGNPDLKPERSLSGDLGLEAVLTYSDTELSASATAFKIWSEDWIYWIPQGSISTPANLRDVNIDGLEFEIGLKSPIGSFTQELSGQYSINRSLNASGSNEGKQLIYVPRHSAGGHWNLSNSKWQFNVQGNYTGIRYTTLNNTIRNSVAPFSLVDVSLSRMLQLKEHVLELGMDVYNILDEDYENYVNLAMPRRNYSMHLTLKL